MTETPSSPSSLGDWLATRRAELGLDLDSVARTTRIRKVFLQALEQNDFTALPGKAYISGFLKNYAELLGLDPAEALARYQGQIVPPQQTTAQAQARPAASTAQRPAPQPARNGQHWLGPLIALVAVLALIGYWIGVQAPQSRPVPPPPAPSAAQSDQPAPSETLQTEATAESAAGSAAPTPAEPSTAPAQASPAPAATPVPETPLARPSAIPPAAPPVTAPAPAAAPAEQTPLPTLEPAGAQTRRLSVLPAGVAIMTLSARTATQLSVEVDNRPAQRYDLTQDSELSWPVRRRARLLLDDPAAVTLSLAGTPLDLQGARDLLLLPRQAD